MKLKTTILAAALALCSGVAFAEDIDLDVTLTNNGGNWSSGFTLTHTQAGAFNDTIDFVPGVTGLTSAGFWTLGFTPASNIDFTSATLYTSASSTGIPLALTPNGFFESGTLLPTLLTGPLRLAISGIAGPGNNVSATYSGLLNISPVPEPETYAMFGAGLGIVGLMARRRSKKGVVKGHGSLAAA